MKKRFRTLFALPLLLPSCSPLYEECYDVRYDDLATTYVPYLEGFNKTYDELKDEYPQLPKIVPGDKISFKRENGKIVDCRLEEAKILKVCGVITPGNPAYRTAGVCFYGTRKEITDSGYSYDNRVMTIREDLSNVRCGFGEMDTLFYATYTEYRNEKYPNLHYQIQSFWTEEAFRMMGRIS